MECGKHGNLKDAVSFFLDAVNHYNKYYHVIPIVLSNTIMGTVSTVSIVFFMFFLNNF